MKYFLPLMKHLIIETWKGDELMIYSMITLKISED